MGTPSELADVLCTNGGRGAIDDTGDTRDIVGVGSGLTDCGGLSGDGGRDTCGG